jgi:benzoate/toluate 1,2-dioxygenase subunit beta
MPEAVGERRLEALLLRAEAEALLHREAGLLDAGDFAGWLDLFAQDARYWIPSNADDVDPSRQVSIVYDHRDQLRERVWRLDSGLAYAQEPRSRTCHLVGNVEASVDDADMLSVTSAFVVTEFRRERKSIYAGRYRHRLRRTADGLAIVLKKVELVDNDGHLGNLSLIL